MNIQKGITALGDVAGGNIDKSQTHIYLRPKTRLEGLIEQLREQIGKDQDAASFVDSLLEWMTPKKSTMTRDLAAKLKACGKEYLLHDALEAKERFAKQLKRTAFNPAIQEVYAYILGSIHSSFNCRIKPIIAVAKTPGLIEGEIGNLAESITTQVANAPVELGIGLPEVIGMLYYLTGNCHLEWDYNAPVPPSD